MYKIPVVISLFSALVISTVSVHAQTNLDEGTVADTQVAESVVAFVADYVELFNARDVAAVDLVSPNVWTLFYSATYDGAVGYLQNGASPITLYEADDVRVHDTGHISVQVTFSGWDTPYSLYTRRWHLLPIDGGGYTIDGGEYTDTPLVPERFTTVELDLVIDLEGITLSDNELTAADVVVFHIENTDAQRVLTTGIYILPDEVSVSQAQTEFAAGNYGVLDYVGPTPVWPGVPWTYAFLVEPRTTYLVQEFTLDDTGQNPLPLVGSAHAAIFTVED